jgi:hypothetical protein
VSRWRPLLITPEVSPLATLDSTRLLAREAVAAALGARTPEWRVPIDVSGRARRHLPGASSDALRFYTSAA